MFCKSGKVGLHEGETQLCLYIQIDLFITECAPEFLCFSIGKGDGGVGVLWFPFIDLLDLLLCWLSFPECFIVNEVVLAWRFRTFLQVLLQ